MDDQQILTLLQSVIPAGHLSCIEAIRLDPLKSKFSVGQVKSKTHKNVVLDIKPDPFLPSGASVVVCKVLDEGFYFPATGSFVEFDRSGLDDFRACVASSLNSIGGSPFGCCSQYVACSNAKMCVHPNPFYANGCAYRKALSSGKIFYGVNADD